MTQMMETNVIIPEDIRKMHQLAVKFKVIVSVVGIFLIVIRNVGVK